MSRGGFIKTTAGVSAGVLGSHVWLPTLATAAGSNAPNPIPSTTVIGPFGAFHLHFPVPGEEPATITDFNGVTGVAHVTGTGTGMEAGVSNPLTFDADMRFMQGLYTGQDGMNHSATFGFI
jgi:hypothetical protein